MKMKEAAAKARRTGKAVNVTEGTPTAGIRVGISLKVDHETLTKLKARAEGLGMPYQTFINSILTQEANHPSTDAQIRKLELEISLLRNAFQTLLAKVESIQKVEKSA